MKEFIPVICVLFIFSTNIFAQDFNSEVKAEASVFVPGTVLDEHFNVAAQYSFTYGDLEMETGIAVNNKQFNYSVQGTYYPFHFDFDGKLKKYDLGFKETLNYKRLYGSSNQINMLLGLQNNFDFGNFYLNLGTHLQTKASFIDGIKNIHSFVPNFDPAFDVLFGGNITSDLGYEVGFLSWDFYKFNRFLTPVFSFSMWQKLFDLVTLDYSIRFNGIDNFTLSAFWEDVEIRIGGSYAF